MIAKTTIRAQALKRVQVRKKALGKSVAAVKNMKARKKRLWMI